MENNSKIGIKQAHLLFVISVASPIIRIVPIYVASNAKQAGWLVPLFCIIPCLIIIYIINALINKVKSNKIKVESIEQCYELAMGKWLSKGICFIMGIWFVLLATVQLKMFTARFVSTLSVYASLDLFIISMLAIIFISARTSLQNFARFTEIFSWLFLIVFVFICIVTTGKIDIDNLLPVTTYDLKGIIQSSVSIIGIFSTLTFIYFAGEYITNKENCLKSGKKSLAYLTIASILVIVITIGGFGALVVSNMEQPFFITLKNINIFGILEGMQSIAISFWVISDFILINLYVYLSTLMFKKTFKLKSRQTTVTPIIFVIYIFSYMISKDYFTLSSFSSIIVHPINILLGAVLPLIIYVILKIKGKILKTN